MSIIIAGKGEQPSTLHEYSNDFEYGYGMYHAMTEKKSYEPQRTTDFEIIITGLNGLTNIATGEVMANLDETLRLAVTSFSFPHYVVTPQEQRRGNSVMKYAGVPKLDSGKISVRDWIGSDTKMALETWRHQAYDEYTDKVGLMEDYKRDCTLIELTPSKQIVRAWKLYGCWVTGVEESDWDHTSENGERIVTANFVFDRVNILREFPGLNTRRPQTDRII